MRHREFNSFTHTIQWDGGRTWIKETAWPFYNTHQRVISRFILLDFLMKKIAVKLARWIKGSAMPRYSICTSFFARYRVSEGFWDTDLSDSHFQKVYLWEQRAEEIGLDSGEITLVYNLKCTLCVTLTLHIDRYEHGWHLSDLLSTKIWGESD